MREEKSISRSTSSNKSRIGEGFTRCHATLSPPLLPPLEPIWSLQKTNQPVEARCLFSGSQRHRASRGCNVCETKDRIPQTGSEARCVTGQSLFSLFC